MEGEFITAEYLKTISDGYKERQLNRGRQWNELFLAWLPQYIDSTTLAAAKQGMRSVTITPHCVAAELKQYWPTFTEEIIKRLHRYIKETGLKITVSEMYKSPDVLVVSW
jgi:hypothetical protein